MDRQIDIARLSARFRARCMTPADAAEILALYRTNPQYFEACGAPAAREGVLRDLAALPPGKDRSDKYFVGFYDGARLIALLDWVAGYPDARTAYIGLFMVDGTCAGQGLGTALLEESFAALRAAGFDAAQLCYKKDHPRACRFWRKNGFAPLREAPHAYGTMIVARRALSACTPPVKSGESR